MEDQASYTLEAVVRFEPRGGIHARPASGLVRLAHAFECDIWLLNALGPEEWVSARNIMDLMYLTAGHGSRVTVRATGPDARIACEAFKEALEAETTDRLYEICDQRRRLKLGLPRADRSDSRR